jgi:hypothetical protein
MEKIMSDADGATITGSFDTRRDAELVVEYLVQEQQIERTDIFIATDGAENSAGTIESGADAESGHDGVATGGEPALLGAIIVSVDVEDAALVSKVRDAIETHGGKDIAVE